ncbi:MAG: DUF126 domain-containing protein [Thermoplasmata archaeon]|nr:DUF126 domain-containing protein [Thermoplasmata archaeon]
MKGKTIYPGRVEGCAVVSMEPIGFYGGVDVKSGEIVEKGHPLEGRSIKGKILVFPHGKGSTVGSYIIYGLKRYGNAPLAIVTENIDTVVAAGVILAGIPCVDGIDISRIRDGDIVVVDGDKGEIEIKRRAEDG